MAQTKPVSLPLIPLPKGTVLLPGIVLRISVSASRPDIPAILSHVYSQAASKTQSQRLDSIHIGCVPLSSPLLSQHGQNLITENERSPKPKEPLDINPATASKEDLFGYGVAAKITGVEGRGTGEFALIVEGISRMQIEKVTQEKPFLEAEVTYKHDNGKPLSGFGNYILIASQKYPPKTLLFKACSHISNNCLVSF
jgi:ATP-dependent Lon protease